MLESLQFVISFFERKPFRDQHFDLGNGVAGLAIIFELRHKTAQLVPLSAVVFAQLLHGSLLSQDAPVPGQRDSKAFA